MTMETHNNACFKEWWKDNCGDFQIYQEDNVKAAWNTAILSQEKKIEQLDICVDLLANRTVTKTDSIFVQRKEIDRLNIIVSEFRKSNIPKDCIHNKLQPIMQYCDTCPLSTLLTNGSDMCGLSKSYSK